MTHRPVRNLRTRRFTLRPEIDHAHFHFALRVSPQHFQAHVLADAGIFERRREVGERLRRFPIGRDDDVADRSGSRIEGTDAGLIRRRTAAHADHYDAADTQLCGHALVCRGDADTGPRRAAVLDDLRYDAVDEVDRYCEAD